MPNFAESRVILDCYSVPALLNLREMAGFLKWLLVFGLLAAGTFFLLRGLGIPVPLIKYKGLEGHQVPAGVVLLAAGIALASLWKVSTEESSGTTTTSEDGSTTTEWWKKTVRTFKGR